MNKEHFLKKLESSKQHYEDHAIQGNTEWIDGYNEAIEYTHSLFSKVGFSEETKYKVVDKHDNILLVKVEKVMGASQELAGKVIAASDMRVGMKASILLTHKEITKYDERYFAFAKPIKLEED